MTKKQKQKLTDSELGQLQAIRRDRATLVNELGQIHLLQIDLDERKEKAIEFKKRIESFEASLSTSITEKYGNVSIDLKTGAVK